jgi:hypothetical protein
MKLSCSLLFFLLLNISFSELRISLLTTSPGTQSHALFGHSALRVIDEENDFEKVFNFGWFDFGTPNFPLRVLQGDLEYWLGLQSIDNFIKQSNKEERLITEHVLDLSASKAAAMFLDLLENREQENRYYLYSFTQKNCSTEIRDLFMKHSLIGSRAAVNKTYRQQLNEYLGDQLWYKFGMNALMGEAVDYEMTWEQQLFMPDNLSTVVADSPGLVKETNKLNEVSPITLSSFVRTVSSPWFIFSCLFVMCLFYRPKWLQFTLYLLLGLFGAFSLYLWMTSLHPELGNNFNLLWANPFYLLVIPFVGSLGRRKIPVYIIAFCLFLVPVFWLFNLQWYDWQIIPLLGILMLYSIKNIKELKVGSELNKSLSH